MPLRQILLRIMLWSLGAGAIFGTIAILGGQESTMWRVCGTTIVAAVSAFLMMPVSLLIDKPQGRPAGLLGMGIILVEFFLGIMLIWEITDFLPVARQEESAAFTMLFLFLCGVPAMPLLRMCRYTPTRLAGVVGVSLASAIFLLLMIGSWSFSWTTISNDWLDTGAAVASLGVPIVACLIMIDTRERPLRRWLLPVQLAGIAASAVAMVMAIVGIWMNTNQGIAAFATMVSIAIVAAVTNLAALVPLIGGQCWVRRITIAVTIAAAVCIDAMVILGDESSEEFLTRLAGAAGVIASCGGLALLVLARINRRVTVEARELQNIREITIICPGCSKKQTLPVGRASCPACRVRFNIRIEEPRCPKCDYLIYMLTGDRCPECGTLVSEAVGAPLALSAAQ